MAAGFWLDLLLNVFCRNQLVEFLDVRNKSFDDPWVKSTTRHASEQGQRIFALHSFPIRPVTAGRIVKVHDRDDSRHEGNGFTLQTLRITTAIPFFMVVTDDVLDGVREVNSPQDVSTDSGMDFHFGKLSLS